MSVHSIFELTLIGVLRVTTCALFWDSVASLKLHCLDRCDKFGPNQLGILEVSQIFAGSSIASSATRFVLTIPSIKVLCPCCSCCYYYNCGYHWRTVIPHYPKVQFCLPTRKTPDAQQCIQADRRVQRTEYALRDRRCSGGAWADDGPMGADGDTLRSWGMAIRAELVIRAAQRGRGDIDSLASYF